MAALLRHIRKDYLVGRLSALAISLLRPQFEAVHLAIGQVHNRLNLQSPLTDIRSADLKIFSQFGGDGILQYILRDVPVQERTFVELGAGDYRESNTRFLVENDNWEGLVVDGGTEHLRFLETTKLRWQHRVFGRSAFITSANVNSVISDAGFEGDIGLLSIDLDGNDYWILNSIDVIKPRVLIVEYNSVFGSTHAVVVPYDAAFVCSEAHPSQLYFGASLGALAHLAVRKGYRLVATDRAGVNAFFVREDVGGSLRALEVAEAWLFAQHRMPTDPNLWLDAASLQRARLALIRDLPLYDVARNVTLPVREIFGID